MRWEGMGDMDEQVVLKCLEITQPIGTFYVGVMEASDLVGISYADVRRISERDVEQYLGIQRPLSQSRVKEIAQYVTTVDATFPTGVILAINSDDASYDRDTGVMTIACREDVAKIIDGQHRIAGLRKLGNTQFQINVVIFIDMDIEDQAMVFATINLAQTRVRKSLVYDLYEYTKSRSPTKTCHKIARLLNSRQNSPFYDRIKILGTATRPYQPLTQAAFVEALLGLISGDRQKALLERDLIKRGKQLYRAPSDSDLVFRNMFIDERDAEIARVVWNYFAAVKNTWTQHWEGVAITGNILPRTNGFRALMRFLPTVYRHLGGPGTVPTESEFTEVFEALNMSDATFDSDTYKPGSGGESRLLNDFRQHFAEHVGPHQVSLWD